MISVSGGKNKFHENLKRQILMKEFYSHSNLDEVSLGERYGAAHTPVREIFLLLESEGYVSIQGNRSLTTLKNSALARGKRIWAHDQYTELKTI